jgi:hypothetical protein
MLKSKVKSIVGGAKLAIDSELMKQKAAGEVITSADHVLTVLRKAARDALRESGLWNQEFHNNEIPGVIAMFLALARERAEK